MSKIVKITLAVLAVIIVASVSIFYTVQDNSQKKDDAAANGNTASIAKVKAGDKVELGSFEQDNNTANGQEKIIWQVVAAEKNKALLITDKILESMPFDEEEEETVSWEQSTLRTWLNEDFLDIAFTSKENAAIIKASLDNTRYDSPHGYYSPGSSNTKDKVFVLSLEEAEKYYDDDSSRIALGTVYAKSKDLDLAPVKDKKAASSYWWLRSTGYYPSCAGSIDFYGHSVDYAISGTHVGVRPAIWVSMKS